MPKIFAYTKDAKLTKKTIDLIAGSGFIPVPVESLDCIRIIESIPDAESSIIFRAAVETLLIETYSDQKKTFATKVLKAIVQNQAKQEKEQANG